MAVTCVVLLLFASALKFSEALTMFNYECPVRYEMADILRRENNCTMRGMLFHICRKNIVVSYADVRPYVFKGEHGVEGLLPGTKLKSLFLST